MSNTILQAIKRRADFSFQPIRAVSFALESLVPKRCLLCDESFSQDLCIGCRHGLQLSSKPEESIFSYNGTIKDILIKIKFEPCQITASRLTQFILSHKKLLANLNHLLQENSIEQITYVPVHHRRLYQRGFDLPQIFSESLANQYQIKHTNLLRRIDFKTSSTLRSKRKNQIEKPIFRIHKPISPSKILLIDDVKTTGATLQSAQKILEQDGHKITTFAIAFTDLKKENFSLI